MNQSNYNHLSRGFVGCLAGVLLGTGMSNTVQAYPRYRDPSSNMGNCFTCHGAFNGPVSPKNSLFPGDSKHEMHNGNSSMNTDCDLCHTNGDNRNPYIKSSNGTANNAGLGCTGCHVAAGLRAHHQANGVPECVICHGTGSPGPESASPPYYGTADTRVNNPCNDVLTSNTNENWSLGDHLGLDNDGDNLYDLADFDCGPRYHLLSAVREGNNVRVTWETMGGRVDAVQASTNVAGVYSDVSAYITNTGVGPVVTNYVEVGGASDAMRFYRVRSVP